MVNDNYIKDLSVLGTCCIVTLLTRTGRDLATVLMVDNSPHVFGYQLDNGIPILDWFNDPADLELINLIPLLKHVHEGKVDGSDFVCSSTDCQDVRPFLRKQFKLYKKVRKFHEQLLTLSRSFGLSKSLESSEGLVAEVEEEGEGTQEIDDDEYDRSKHKKARRC